MNAASGVRRARRVPAGAWFVAGALLVGAFAQACTRAAAPPAAESLLRVAAVQFDARPERPRENLAAMERLAREAAARGARLVLFHENALVDYGAVSELAEPVPAGPACREVARLAAELELWIGFGLPERDGERVYMTHTYFGPAGFVGRARKTRLFANPADPRRDEPAHFTAGEGPAVLELAGVRTVTLICADEDDPELVRAVRELAPALVLFPNNRSNLPPAEDFAPLARALGAPLVLANRVGRSWQYGCNGGSCVLGADGEVLARANRRGGEEVLLVDVPVGR